MVSPSPAPGSAGASALAPGDNLEFYIADLNIAVTAEEYLVTYTPPAMDTSFDATTQIDVSASLFQDLFYIVDEDICGNNIADTNAPEMLSFLAGLKAGTVKLPVDLTSAYVTDITPSDPVNGVAANSNSMYGVNIASKLSLPEWYTDYVAFQLMSTFKAAAIFNNTASVESALMASINSTLSANAGAIDTTLVGLSDDVLTPSVNGLDKLIPGTVASLPASLLSQIINTDSTRLDDMTQYAVAGSFSNADQQTVYVFHMPIKVGDSFVFNIKVSPAAGQATYLDTAHAAIPDYVFKVKFNCLA
jgi:hypothetical protein